MVCALGEASEWTVAVNGDVSILDIRPLVDSFLRTVSELHYRHGHAQVMEWGAGDREDGSDLTRYALARATVISRDGKVWG